MSEGNPTYQELQARLAQAEAFLTALRSGEVDAVISHSAVLLLCVQETEEALRESEARYRSLFEHSLDAILLTATDGRILMANPTACRLFGWTADELGRMREDALVDHTDPTMLAAWAARAGAEQFQGELTYLRQDRSTFVGDTSSATFSGLDGEKKSTIIIRDITARKRAEAALHQAQAELAYVTSMLTLGALTTSIAHEVNQPLTAVMNNGNACLRWLGRTPPDLEAVQEALQDIVCNGRRAGDIIARMRAALKKVPTHTVPLDLNALIMEVVGLQRYEVQRRAVRLRTDFAADLPLVAGDPVQVQQVLLNLVLNGLDAMSVVMDRPRELLIRSEHMGADRVHVAVYDTGIGLDPQTQTRLFEPFFTTKPDGLGLGLAISRTIIEAHGGHLWVTRNPGHGTTFHFILPTASEHVHV